VRLYLSHAIRGTAGLDASHDVQAMNCAEAIRIANMLRAAFPKLILYVPAENETFVQIAFDSGHINEKAILDVDCKIIDRCDGVLIYVPAGDELQGGRKIECDHAIATKKPVCIFSRIDEATDYLYARYRGELL